MQRRQLRELLRYLVHLAPYCETELPGAGVLAHHDGVMSEPASALIGRYLHRVRRADGTEIDHDLVAAAMKSDVPEYSREEMNPGSSWATHPYLETAERCSFAGEGRLAAWWVNRYVDMHMGGVDLDGVQRLPREKHMSREAWTRLMLLRRVLSECDDCARAIDEVDGMAMEVRIGGRVTIDPGPRRQRERQRTLYGHPRVMTVVDGMSYATSGNHSPAALLLAGEGKLEASEVIQGTHVEVVAGRAPKPTLEAMRLIDPTMRGTVRTAAIDALGSVAGGARHPTTEGLVVGEAAKIPYTSRPTRDALAALFPPGAAGVRHLEIPPEVDRCPLPRRPLHPEAGAAKTSTKRGLS